MPSKSPAQHRLMEAVAHNPKFAKQAGIPQSVGQDFAAADAKLPGPATAPAFDHEAHIKQLKREAHGAPAVRRRDQR